MRKRRTGHLEIVPDATRAAFAEVFKARDERNAANNGTVEPPQPTTMLTLASQQHEKNGLRRPVDGFRRDDPISDQFVAIMAHNAKCITQVVFKIITSTGGWEQTELANDGWVPMSYVDFQKALGLSASASYRGINGALKARYIRRVYRQRRYWYALNWARTKAQR